MSPLSKYHWHFSKSWNKQEPEKTPYSKGKVEKETQNWDHHITMPNFKLYYRAVSIKSAWYWYKNRHINQWDRIENPKMDSQLYGQPIFGKSGMNIQWKKNSLFNKWCWENWTSTCRRMKLGHSFTPYTKINSKWMKDHNVRQKSIKILEENIGSNLFDLGHSNFFQATSLGALGWLSH